MTKAQDDAEINLRSLEIFPLNIQRLLNSRLWLRCRRRPELAFYAMNLWLRAFHATPVGSLENDDELLCDIAGCAPDRWPDVRADALAGFELRADGRVHHAVIIEMAASAVERRVKWAEKKREYRARLKAEADARAKGGAPSSPDQDVGEDVRGDTSRTPEDVRGSPGLEGRGLRVEGRGLRVENLNGSSPDGDEPVPSAVVGGVPLDEAMMATALWNEMVQRVNEREGREVLPSAIRPNAARRKLILTRLRECGGIDGWAQVMASIEASDFLCGRSARSAGHENWRPNLGWIVEARNFTKIREGAFSGKGVARPARMTPGQVAQAWLDADPTRTP